MKRGTAGSGLGFAVEALDNLQMSLILNPIISRKALSDRGAESTRSRPRSAFDACDVAIEEAL
jgi:hypothetical protein